MKALQILKDNRNNIDYLIQHQKLNKDEIGKYKNRFKYLNEAIEELEALQNRSCNNCKFNIDFKNLTDEEYIVLQEKCSRCCIFYDSKWESK